MKKTFAILSAMTFACAISLPAPAQPQNAAKLKRVQMAKEKEQHPEIAAAIRHLKEAKQNLEHASHDFGGHRVTALKHIDEALEECHRALEFDKK
jgi:hypothetical protein